MSELAWIIPTDTLVEFMLSVFATLLIVGLEVQNPREGVFPPKDTARYH